MWVGLLGDRIIDPCTLPTSITSGTYLQLLQIVIPQLVDHIPLATRACIYVCEWLDYQFPQRWIGHGGPRAYSPNLNLVDFFILGHCKNLMHITDVECSDALWQQVQYKMYFGHQGFWSSADIPYALHRELHNG